MSALSPLSDRSDLSNPMPRSAFSFSFFASSQVKYFTDPEGVYQRVYYQAHINLSGLITPLLCRPTLEFDVFFWYETPDQRKDTRLMPGFIGPSHARKYDSRPGHRGDGNC